MAAGADDSQSLVTEVMDAFASVERSLRKWAVEGPPGNQRGTARDLADRLVTAISQIQGLASESAGLQKESGVNKEKLADFEKEIESLKASIAELKSQKDLQETHFKKQSSEDLAKLQRDLCKEKESDAVKIAQLQSLVFERGSMGQEDLASAMQASKLQAKACELQRQVDTSAAEITKLRQREATTASQVASVLAPVTAMCRMRPLGSYHSKDSGDDDAPARSALVVDGGEITVEGFMTCPKQRKFLVDRVLDGEHHSQNDVFGSVSPWVENVMAGGTSCIMAYGATGSGKTYTLHGKGSSTCPGIAHNALKRLIDGRSGGEVRLSIVEVYCDQIRDLLAQSGPSEVHGTPSLQCCRRDGRSRFVEELVSEYSKAENILNHAFSNRITDATRCNDTSSRSHVVLTVERCGQEAGASASGGRLVLIDLAGSENIQKSGADEGGKLLTEAKAINSSLSALAKVVEALAKRQSFVPYRDSRLTQLLEETLKGAKVCLLVHVSPLTIDVVNTGHSLQFAGKMRAVDFGAQQLRKDQEERSRKEQLRNIQENRQLQTQLEDQKKDSTLKEQNNQELKQQVARLSEQLREAKRDLTREQELRNTREASIREHKRPTTPSGGLAEPVVVCQRPPSPLTRSRSPLLRQPAAARRAGTPVPRKLPDFVAEDSKVNASAPESGTRVPFSDMTNCKEQHAVEGHIKKALAASVARFPAKDEPVAPETPTKPCDDIAADGSENDDSEVWSSEPQAKTVQISVLPVAASSGGDDEATANSNGRPVKSVLRKVPTNFIERQIQGLRSASCPPLGARKDDTRIRFADKLQEACSPPRWYLDWLESDSFTSIPGRGTGKKKVREISPRRSRQALDAVQSQDSDPPRWR